MSTQGPIIHPVENPDFHGVPLRLSPGGKRSAGPVFGPIYEAEGGNYVLVDDPKFVSTTSDSDAAKLAVMYRADTTLCGLTWTKRVASVGLHGILCRKGKVGPIDVLFIDGPILTDGKRNDAQTIAARRAAGLPTGEPGDRRIKLVKR